MNSRGVRRGERRKGGVKDRKRGIMGKRGKKKKENTEEEGAKHGKGGWKEERKFCLTASTHYPQKKQHPEIPWAPAHLKEMVLSALSATPLARSTSAVCR